MGNEKTMKNLMEAFAGESQANRKYTAYAKKRKLKESLMRRSYSELLLMRKHCTRLKSLKLQVKSKVLKRI